MAEVIETIKCHCNECGHKQKVNVAVFERFESIDEVQAFVDATFVRPCDYCAATSWEVDTVKPKGLKKQRQQVEEHAAV